VGDVRRLALRRRADGPITQITRDQQVPLLDVGTLREIRAGRLAVAAVVLATGYRAAVDEFLVGWEAVCDADGTPRRSGAPPVRWGA
jgi:hypothetical protein